MSSSYEANTTDQYRQSFQYSSTVDGLLKDVYLPALNNTTFHSTPLMEMFGEFGGTIDFIGNKIIQAYKHQGAGGFGAIAEGGDFVNGRMQKGFQGYERIKYLNAFFSLTGPAARTVKSGQGAYVDAISSAMDDTLKLAKMNMERILGGAGNGELCRFSNVSDGTNDVTDGQYLPSTDKAASSTFNADDHLLTATSGGAYTKTQWLQNGIRVNIVDKDNFDAQIGSAELIGPFEVGHVDYEAEKFSLKNVSGSTIDVSTELAEDTFVLVLEGAYGEAELDETTDYTCLEPNGLYNLVSDGVNYSAQTGGVDESATNYAKVWNLSRSDYADSLKSMVKNAAGNELDEELLMRWVLDLVNIKQSVPNVMVTDPKSRLKYFSNRKEDRRFDTTVMDTSFGFRHIGVTIDEYNMTLHSLTSMKPGSLMLLNTGDFKWAKATNGFEWSENGGRILRNYESKDAMFGTALNYTNFVCNNPRGQLKAFGISYDE